MSVAYAEDTMPARSIKKRQETHWSKRPDVHCIGLAERLSIAAQFAPGTSAIYLRVQDKGEAMIVGRRYFDNGLLRTFLAGDAWRSGAIVEGIGYEE